MEKKIYSLEKNTILFGSFIFNYIPNKENCDE